MKLRIASLVLCLLLTACAKPPPEELGKQFLEDAFPRERIVDARVLYYAPDGATSSYAPIDGALNDILDMLYAAVRPGGDAMPIDAPDAAICLTLEAGDTQAQCLISSTADDIDVYVMHDDERLLLRASAPGLRAMLRAHEADALVEYAYTPDTAPPRIDPALRAGLAQDALTKPLAAVEVTHMDYPPQDAPLYRVLTADDAEMTIGEEQLLIVAAYGLRATEGYAIRIDAVEADEEMARVRVTLTAPNEGDWVKRTQTSPIDSVTVSADAIPSDSTVAFIDQDGKLLYLQSW